MEAERKARMANIETLITELKELAGKQGDPVGKLSSARIPPTDEFPRLPYWGPNPKQLESSEALDQHARGRRLAVCYTKWGEYAYLPSGEAVAYCYREREP